MVQEDWQIGFSVKGLRAPDEILLNNYFLIKGTPHDNAYVFLKVTIDDEEEKNNLRDRSVIEINNVTQLYGLITNIYTQVQSGTVSAKISSESPFGHTKYPPDFLGFIPMPTDKQREDTIPFLKKTIDKYKFVKNITEKKRKRFLLNAIDYYHRSLGNYSNEEKLIDLMICLESLFSREAQELRLRYSLRMAYLLGANQQKKLRDIFRNVYDLYPKRSKVVHGIEDVELNEKNIWTFRNNLKEAIKIFIHIEMSKEELLQLLDESIYDSVKRKKLREIVSEAVKKW